MEAMGDRSGSHDKTAGTIANERLNADGYSSNKSKNNFLTKEIRVRIFSRGGVRSDPWPRRRCEGDPTATGTTIKIFPHTFVAWRNKS